MGITEGNLISNNEYGIYIDENVEHGGLPAEIVGNKIGTDIDGTLDFGNTNYGIWVDQTANPLTIGTVPVGVLGFSGGQGNTIAGNGTDGIEIGYVPDDAITIRGNNIGIGSDDTTQVGNGSNGIFAQDGRPLEITGNLIGNSGTHGVLINGPWFSFSGNADALIAGNWIGTNRDGDAHPNVGDGIVIEHTGRPDVEISDNVIGHSDRGIFLGEESEFVLVVGNYVGTNEDDDNLGNVQGGIRSTSLEGAHIIGREDEGNVIGWNGTNGIAINNSVNENLIMANRVGVTMSGDPIPNERHGISVLVGAGADAPVIIGSDLATNTADYLGKENRIHFNDNDGVSLGDDAWAVIRANRMRENGDLAIDLGADGRTANELGDSDAGANLSQNFPEIDEAGSSYDEVTGELTMEYRVSSFTVNSPYDLRVDFYVADAVSLQPQRHIGEDVYQAALANADRVVQFFPTLSLPDDAVIVATATDADGRTSEVSEAVSVPEPNLALGLVIGALGLGAIGRRGQRRSSITMTDA